MLVCFMASAVFLGRFFGDHLWYNKPKGGHFFLSGERTAGGLVPGKAGSLKDVGRLKG